MHTEPELKSEVKDIPINKVCTRSEIVKFMLIFLTVFQIYITSRYFLIEGYKLETSNLFGEIKNPVFMSPLFFLLTVGWFSIPLAFLFLYKAISEIKKKRFFSIVFFLSAFFAASFPAVIESYKYLIVG